MSARRSCRGGVARGQILVIKENLLALVIVIGRRARHAVGVVLGEEAADGAEHLVHALGGVLVFGHGSCGFGDNRGILHYPLRLYNLAKKRPNKDKDCSEVRPDSPCISPGSSSCSLSGSSSCPLSGSSS